MSTEMHENAPRWYVLNHIGNAFQYRAKSSVDNYNLQFNCDLELFAPTYVIREERNGEVRMKTAKLTFHYVFVRGAFKSVKQLCSQDNGFSFLINRSSGERYAVISDRDMTSFKNIARAYQNCLPYYSLDEVDLEEGDLVEVINGDFPGLIGTYLPKAKSKSGNIVLNIYNNVCTIAFNVKATDVRVLQFAQNTTRANDQIDAFVPHMLKALVLFNNDEALPTALQTKLSVFCSRMGEAKLNNHKLDAKLQALLYGANYVFGDMTGAGNARERYNKVKDAVTNEWTRALIDLIFSVTERDRDAFSTALARVKELKATSRFQTSLTDAYNRVTIE